MINIEVSLTKQISGAQVACRPSGQTYPAVICDGLPTRTSDPQAQAIFMGAVGGAIAGSVSGAAGAIRGAIGGAIGAGLLNDRDKK